MTLALITAAVLSYFGTVAYMLGRKFRSDHLADPDPRMTRWLRGHPRRRHLPFIDD